MSHSFTDVLLLFWYVFLATLESAYRWVVPPAPKSIQGKVVLVTGAGSGIGRQLAYQLQQQGARLVLWDINKEGCNETASNVNTQGGFAKSYVCDVSSFTNVKKVALQVREDVGDVDILINNAGVMYCNNVFQQTEEKMRKTMEVNVLAHFWTVKVFLPYMYDKNDGHIVNVASMAAESAGVAHIADYSASKCAVVGFTESVADEMRMYKKTGVYSSIVFPVFVNTNLLSEEHIRYEPGPDGKMEPKAVADIIVQGILRNKAKIYVPPKICINAFIVRTIPTKVLGLLKEFSGAGFFYKTNKQE